MGKWVRTAGLALAGVILGLASRPALAGGVFQLNTTFGSGQLSVPFGNSVDSDGNLYVANLGGAITVYDANHAFVRTIGAGTLSGPWSVAAAPNGTIYALDTGHSRIQPMSPLGVIGAPIGTLQSGHGIATDAASNVYVAETGANRITKFSPAGAPLMTITDGLSAPYGVAVDATGNIYIADTFNDRVMIYDAGGVFTRSFSTVIPAWPDTHPKELTVAGDGTIFMSLGDPGFAAFSSDGTLLDTYGGLDRAAGVALYGNTLYGVELGRSRVLVFTVPEPGLGILTLGLLAALSARRRRV